MKNPDDTVQLVDAGDAIQGEPLGSLTRGQAIIDIMNVAGYDFAIPGNHEFDYGMARFLELAPQLNGGYYSCNLIDLRTGKPVFPPYKMVTYDGGKKAAFIGVTTPQTLISSTPRYFQDDKGSSFTAFPKMRQDRNSMNRSKRPSTRPGTKEPGPSSGHPPGPEWVAPGLDQRDPGCTYAESGSHHRWSFP